MILELILLFVIFYLYFLFYMSFKINVNNEIYEFDKTQTRRSISSETNLKLPFYFNIKHIFKKPNNLDTLKLIQKTNHHRIYRNLNKKYTLFEPYMKHKCENECIEIKSHSDIEVNMNKSTFYYVYDKNIRFHIIHPNYCDHLLSNGLIKQDKKTIKYIKDNPDFIHFNPSQNDIIYIPNYWYVFIEHIGSTTETKSPLIEKLSYVSIIDDLISSLEKVFNKK
jgi:hypothetical protein